jgi:hypothetical protein
LSALSLYNSSDTSEELSPETNAVVALWGKERVPPVAASPPSLLKAGQPITVASACCPSCSGLRRYLLPRSPSSSRRGSSAADEEMTDLSAVPPGCPGLGPGAVVEQAGRVRRRAVMPRAVVARRTRMTELTP